MNEPQPDLVLREVPGPAALGGGFRRALDLLFVISVSDFKKIYFGTVLGYFWSLGRPLLLFAVLYEVFTRVFRLGSTVPHYAVMLLMNIVLFGFFQEATTFAVGSIVAQESVVRKTQFPRLVIPLAVVLTSLFNLALNLVVVVIFLLATGVSPRWTWLGFPLLLIPLIVLTTAISMIVASLYPRFRDVQIIWTVFCAALFYATPVLYPVSALRHHAAGLRDLILANPLTPILELARKWIIDPSAPGPKAAAGGYTELLVPTAIFVAICLLAVWTFTREAPRIAEQL